MWGLLLFARFIFFSRSSIPMYTRYIAWIISKCQWLQSSIQTKCCNQTKCLRWASRRSTGIQRCIECKALVMGYIKAAALTELCTTRVQLANLGSLQCGRATCIKQPVTEFLTNCQSFTFVKQVLAGRTNVAHEIVDVLLTFQTGAFQWLHITKCGFNLLLHAATILLEPSAVLQSRLCFRGAIVEEWAVLHITRRWDPIGAQEA